MHAVLSNLICFVCFEHLFSILISWRHSSPLFSILISSGFYFYIYCFWGQHKRNHQISIFWLPKLNLMAFEIKQICIELSHRKAKKPRLCREIICGLNMWWHLRHFLWLKYLNSNVEISLAFLFSVLTFFVTSVLRETVNGTVLFWCEKCRYYDTTTLTFNLVRKVTMTL